MTNKLRVYESKALADVYAIACQIQHQIDVALASSENPGELPASLIPTENIYDIVVCYNAMYNLLVEYSLIKEGHIKPSATIH
jgi:hypothetical protein